VSLGGADDVSPETQDQSDGTSSAAAFGNMMFIDYPMIGLNKSKETCTHSVSFSCELQLVIEAHVYVLSVARSV
jgi:hypothetical protein